MEIFLSKMVNIVSTTNRGKDGYHLARVAGYDNSGWSKLDDLQSVRRSQSSMVIKFMSLEDLCLLLWNKVSLELSGLTNPFGDLIVSFPRYTEILNDDEGSKTIKLANPQFWVNP